LHTSDDLAIDKLAKRRDYVPPACLLRLANHWPENQTAILDAENDHGSLLEAESLDDLGRNFEADLAIGELE
jgi:hypothetical protein